MMISIKTIRKSAFIIALFVGLFLIRPAQGQEFYTQTEFGFQLGASTYYGDLNTNYGLHFIRPAAGVFFRYSFTPYIALKAFANYTEVGYSDKFAKNTFQKTRNLSFRSNILEAAIVAEFNFFKFVTGDKYNRFTPYLAGGAGVFYYNPYAKYQGQRYDLRKLGTEGQNTGLYNDRKYSNFSICFPVGAGIKYWVKPGMNFSVAVMDRLTLTDYLDDVSNTYVGIKTFSPDPDKTTVAGYLQDPSIPVNGKKLGTPGKQRGDNSTKDQYLIVDFSFSFQLKTYKCPSKHYSRWYNNL